MTGSLAWDFGPKNVTVNAIAPGGVKTDMYAQTAAEYIPGADRMTVEETDKIVS